MEGKERRREIKKGIERDGRRVRKRGEEGRRGQKRVKGRRVWRKRGRKKCISSCKHKKEEKKWKDR